MKHPDMKSNITAYRYGSPRQPNEGFRLGAARQVPRGVRREDWQRRNYFDLWIPLLAPTADLVADYRHNRISFAAFSRRYKSQIKAKESRQVIELLATTSLFQPISVGCFCEDESRCHRSLLRELILKEAKRKIPGFSHLRDDSGESLRFASPVCFAQERE
jgi:uncharacterized protein YeaO (DUF488 family)